MQLNEGLQKIGKMCFLDTQVRELQLPQGLEVQPEELGIGCSAEDVWLIPDGVQDTGVLQSNITA